MQALKNNVPEDLITVVSALKVDKLIEAYIQAAMAENDDLVDDLEDQIESIIEMAEELYDEDVAEELSDYLDEITSVL